MDNLFADIPDRLPAELSEALLTHAAIRIERIVSRGHAAPDTGWFDQAEHEWVIVVEGAGRILFEDGTAVTLQRGDYVNIPAHTRHRVTWTDPETVTVWLAVFYPQ